MSLKLNQYLTQLGKADRKEEEMAADTTMATTQTPPPIPEEPKFGGFTRFEIELEVCFPFLSIYVE